MSGRRFPRHAYSSQIGEADGGSPMKSLDPNGLEERNDERLSQLHAQVSTLKSITIDIGAEVREQNRLLDNMESEFERTGDVLAQTIKRLTQLTTTERGRNFLFYTAVFFVFVLLLLIFRAMF